MKHMENIFRSLYKCGNKTYDGVQKHDASRKFNIISAFEGIYFRGLCKIPTSVTIEKFVDLQKQ